MGLFLASPGRTRDAVVLCWDVGTALVAAAEGLEAVAVPGVVMARETAETSYVPCQEFSLAFSTFGGLLIQATTGLWWRTSEAV